MPPGIQLEDRPGGVRILTLSNPRKRNALDEAMLRELIAALSPDRGAGIRALLVAGEGEHFCSGFDLAGLESIPSEGPLPDDPLQEAFAALEAYPAVTVACVRGAAFGAGCELALACDLRVFADDAVLCLPPAKLGVVYAPGGLARLAALAGPSRAKWMFFTGRKVRAAEARDWGLCEALHPRDESLPQALAVCEELAQNAPLALRGMKRIFGALARGPLPEEESAEVQRLRREAFLSRDAKEGRQAFLEKRPPKFEGR